MANQQANIVICGAGLAGLSTAYFLAVQQGQRDILVVDELPPLSLTSDHSTECYRNWWPGPNQAMVNLMNRSIDLLEVLAHKSGNIFQLNRRGYLYCSGDPDSPERFRTEAESIYGRLSPVSQLGSGPLRVHTGSAHDCPYIPPVSEGFENCPDGADLLLDADLIHRHFPYLSTEVKAALHVRRAGWLSAQQLGMFFLEQARQAGIRLARGKVVDVEVTAGRIRGVRLDDGAYIRTNTFVNAAGPFIQDIAQMMGVDLPIFNELHLKLAIKDSEAILDRQAPLVIWSDAQKLNWTQDEAAYLAEEARNLPLLEFAAARRAFASRGQRRQPDDSHLMGISHPGQPASYPHSRRLALCGGGLARSCSVDPGDESLSRKNPSPTPGWGLLYSHTREPPSNLQAAGGRGLPDRGAIWIWGDGLLRGW